MFEKKFLRFIESNTENELSALRLIVEQADEAWEKKDFDTFKGLITPISFLATNLCNSSEYVDQIATLKEDPTVEQN